MLEVYEIGSSDAYKLRQIPELFSTGSDQWEVRWDVRSDRPHLIQGAGVPLIPGRGNDLSFQKLGLAQGQELDLLTIERLLRGFMDKHNELLGIEGIELRLDPKRSLAYGADSYFRVVEFQQMYKGVPIEGAHVYFRINHGNIIQFGTNRVADVVVETTPKITREEAFARGLSYVGVTGQPLWSSDQGSLKIFPSMDAAGKLGEAYRGERGRGYQHRLCWEYTFTLPSDGHLYKLVVDARSGETLEFVDLARYAEVKGDVYPETNSDPRQKVGLPFISVMNNGTEKTTDANGVYSFSPGTASASLSGPYVNIVDMCGGSLLTSSNGDIDFGGNQGTDCTTPGYGGDGNTNAARTAFFHINNIHRKAADYLSGNSWLDSTVTVVTNDDGECNAGWNGSTMHFLRSGWASRLNADCTNPGEISDALFHEWGHAMDQHSGGPAPGEKGSGEAVADTFALLENRDGCMGDNFTPSRSCDNCRSSCTGLRDLDAFASGGISTIASPANIADDNGINCDRDACPYTTPYGEPYAGPMGYEAHCESYIASTANYDLAQLLVSEYGSGAGWAKMEQIWWGSLTSAQNAYQVTSGGTCNPGANVDGCGADNWYTVYLSVDDDDGNLANGTPNACRIWQAFNVHGIACGTQPACSDGSSYIDITVPEVGTTWALGSSYRVEWTWENVDGNLQMNLWQGGADLGIVYGTITNDGSVLWTIDILKDGTPIQPGDDYRVQLISKLSPSISDFSDAFSISDEGPWCGDGTCNGDETPVSCPVDCGSCGDGICAGDETPISCPVDCGSCGDGICAGDETPETCPADCGGSFDGSFETTAGWSLEAHPDWPGTSIFRSTWGTADPHTGSYALALSNHGYARITSDFIPAAAGSHTLSTWLRGELDESSWGGYNLRVYFYDANQQALTPAFQDAKACNGTATCVSATWSQRSGTATAPAGTAYVKIRLLSHMFAGWVAYDDVVFDGQILSVSNHGIDGGFETSTGWTIEGPSQFPATSMYRATWGTATPHSGSSAIAVSNHAYGSPTAELQLSPGNHQLSAWVKGEMAASSFGGWIVRAYYYDTSGGLLSWQNAASCTGAATCLSPVWAQVSGTVTVPSQATSVKIKLFFYMANGWVVYDNVAVDGTVLNLATHGVDGGFESESNGWSYDTLSSFPATGVRRDTIAFDGSYGLSISNQSYAQPATDFLSVNGNQTYTISAWMKGEMDKSSKGGWIIRSYFYDQNQSYLSYQDAAACAMTATCSPGLQWVKKSGTVTAPAAAAFMKLYLSFWRSNGWVVYDDVTIQ
jgi:Zn-dependent metalloprotease